MCKEDQQSGGLVKVKTRRIPSGPQKWFLNLLIQQEYVCLLAVVWPFLQGSSTG